MSVYSFDAESKLEVIVDGFQLIPRLTSMAPNRTERRLDQRRHAGVEGRNATRTSID